MMDNWRKRIIKGGFLLVLLLTMGTALMGCSGNTNAKNYFKHEPLPDAEAIFLETSAAVREIAWNELSKEDKESVTGDWKNAQVALAKWEDVTMKKTTEKPDTEALYKVTFLTDRDAQLGPIGIYIDPVTKKIVGYDGRQ
ncbi:hypothetical protein [Paenibacillus sp. MMS18-CY102]|uniref:hypothetical protein n=1 Tax=Paenibacillus sp. MMS18-CY102 TaxID=2682849 RepID=UPI001365ED29|nr:hypothetical protein [Paenibacillus sp. MMS18-CY102]MWC31027.1 hypothetical protein [Paenibacillus sp. MMS18-CY102]